MMTDLDDPKAYAERIAESVKEQTERGGSSRRKFLNRSVLAGGTLLALGSGTGLATSHDEDGAEGEVAANFDDVTGTDLDVLNYALTLENLENAFYREGLELFSEDDFDESDVVSEYSTGTDQSVYEYVTVVGEHEATHVEVLSEAVTLLGGDPEPEASYDFGVETVDEFLATAQVLENTGVAAYAGAAPFVESPDLLGVALSIHSVEARHAALLNGINGESPFPDAFDPVLSQQEVLDAVGPFIESEEEDDEEEDDEEDDEGDEEEEDEEADDEDTEEEESDNGTETDNGTDTDDE